MVMDVKQLRRERSGLVREIKRILKPHFWNSGYRKAVDPRKGLLAGSRPLLVWIPGAKNGQRKNQSWTIRGALVVDEIEGFTEDGPITDSYCAIVTTYWESIPLEDLLLLKAWIEKMIAKEQLPLAA